jgi:hypothetical protein
MPPFSAGLLITIITLRYYYHHRTLIYSIHDSSEEGRRKMIQSSERMIKKENNPTIHKHFELQIKTLLQNELRDVDKLQALLKAKEKEREKQQQLATEDAADTQRLLPSDMFIIVLAPYLTTTVGFHISSS